jgi:hypothetical protein
MIDKIGLEVEGGWAGQRFINPLDIPIIADHSVDGRMFPHDKPMKSPHVGEVISEPMSCEAEFIEEWINKYWPTEANNTCGYHIHLSFTKIKDYSLLTRKSFLFGLIKRMKDLGKELGLGPKHYLWHRLDGQNPFTTINFDAVHQVNIRKKQVADRRRYGMLNCCWNIHKTLEFRALPTFREKIHAKQFTHAYVDEVEEYLATHGNSTVTASGQLLDSFGDLYILR